MSENVNVTLPLQLADVGVLVERRWAAALVSSGISPSEYRVLVTLVEHGPMNPVDVGSRVTLEQSLISRTAQRLYEKRLITRRRSRIDRRNVTLRVTREGEELARQLEQPLRELAEDLARGIPPRRFQQAVEVIEAILDSLEAPSRSG